jgi:hypothetical protein
MEPKVPLPLEKFRQPNPKYNILTVYTSKQGRTYIPRTPNVWTQASVGRVA